jgi:hypothetical protein
MRGRWAILAFAAALLTPSVWGQMRASGRMAVPAGRAGFAPRHSVSFHGGFGHSPRFFFHRNRFFFGPRSSFFFAGSFFSPFAAPAYYAPAYSYGYPMVVQAAPPSAYYPDNYYERGELRRDIDVLTGKVDRLQQDVESRWSAPLPQMRPQSRPEPPRPATVLVFKDHRTREVQNYAIVGRTLWVFSEQRAEKIPLASLDLDATTKLNDERGVEFQAPQ